MSKVKIVVHSPLSHSHIIREALGKAGAGQIGNYSFCSFTTRGIGRSLPNEKAHPAIGTPGKLEEIEEESIEVVMDESLLKSVLDRVRQVHPYEESAIEVYSLLDY